MQIVLIDMRVPIIAVSTLCRAYISELETEKSRKVQHITRRYLAPSEITVLSLVKTDSSWCGIATDKAKKIAPTASPHFTPMEIIFLIGSMRCCPQY